MGAALPFAIGAAGTLLDRWGRPKTQTQTTTSQLDPATEAYRKKLLEAQMAGADMPGGLDPGNAAANEYYSKLQGAGGIGIGALSGNQADISALMNPYQSNVLDQVRGQYGLLNSQAQNGVNDAATMAHSFGGSRHGVASGVASGEIARGLGQQISGLTYQGYNDAMSRAQGLASLGFAGAGAGAAGGEYAAMMNNPALRKAYLLRQGLQGLPYGQTTTGSQPINYPSGAGSFLGWASLAKGLLRK